MLAPEIGAAKRAAGADRGTDCQLIEYILGHAATGNESDLELHFRVPRQAGHRIGSDMFGRELQRRVLARAEFERLGQLDAHAANVVRRLLDGGDGALDDACRMHDHLVELGQLDGAALGQHGLAGEDVGILASDLRTA